jgi:hypothetical protein
VLAHPLLKLLKWSASERTERNNSQTQRLPEERTRPTYHKRACKGTPDKFFHYHLRLLGVKLSTRLGIWRYFGEGGSSGMKMSTKPDIPAKIPLLLNLFSHLKGF